MTNSDWSHAFYRAGMKLMSAKEREAVEGAMRAVLQGGNDVLMRIKDIPAATSRTRRKRKQDEESDKRTRMLIGARVRKELARDIKDLAYMRGVSVYRLVVDALEKLAEEYREEIRRNPPEPVRLCDVWDSQKSHK